MWTDLPEKRSAGRSDEPARARGCVIPMPLTVTGKKFPRGYLVDGKALGEIASTIRNSVLIVSSAGYAQLLKTLCLAGSQTLIPLNPVARVYKQLRMLLLANSPRGCSTNQGNKSNPEEVELALSAGGTSGILE
jgi:hypothetical protein